MRNLRVRLGFEKRRGRVPVRLFGRNRLFYAGNLSVQVADIGFQLGHAEHIQRRGDE